MFNLLSTIILSFLLSVCFCSNASAYEKILITKLAYGCHKKEDAKAAFIAANLKNETVLLQMLKNQSCFQFTPEKKEKVLILKKDSESWAKINLKYIQGKLVEVAGQDTAGTGLDFTLWFTSDEEYKYYEKTK